MQGSNSRRMKVPSEGLIFYYSCLKESSASRTSSVNKSSETKRGLEELMYVKVLVLEKGPMETIYRRHFVAEIGSMESLRDTLQWIVGYGFPSSFQF